MDNNNNSSSGANTVLLVIIIIILILGGAWYYYKGRPAQRSDNKDINVQVDLTPGGDTSGTNDAPAQ
ncbi:MAG: hypothetical protein KA028_01040 [Candidatus Pacebacteria bacterium]|jgi:preprotein translocase subunit YajC|nr:hypothetical protein [Candidatus Paceibacterota bacterium]MBP9852105.1 hypothetical protein [Candidatus Paceibacterota bacterium]